MAARLEHLDCRKVDHNAASSIIYQETPEVRTI